LRVLLIAQMRQQPARLSLMIAVIAIGVALGMAVYLVNATALNEFTLASKRLIGEADVVVRSSASGFPEDLYPRLARLPAVKIASPVLELQAAIPGKTMPLKILGIDLFRAAALQPALLTGLSGDVRRMFAPNGIFLSTSAAAELGLKPHDALTTIVGSSPVKLEVLGVLPSSAYAQPIGLMDIASAQWTFDQIGRLNRVDLRLGPGTDVTGFRNSLTPTLPAGVLAIAPEVERDRAVTVTRAYRVNLNMLALVSLLTSAFLVFSIQSLSLLRRRASIALLRAIGVTGSQIQRALLAEGAAIGALGSALGVLLGVIAAMAAVRLLNGDLGNAQIHVASDRPIVEILPLLTAFVIGTAFSCAGAWLPAREASMRPPALALKSGDSELRLDARRMVWPGLLLLAVGGGFLLLPPRHGVPVAGYFAIAALLFGAIFWVPMFTRMALRAIPRFEKPILDTAVAQLNGSHGTLFLSLAPIIVSFALMVSMAIMVHSFRHSFEIWLVKLLPADVELRLPPGTNTAGLSAEDQQTIRTMPGVAQADFRRTQTIYLSADNEPVMLIARDMARKPAGEILPLVAGDPSSNDDDGVWVSEAAHDKYGFSVGQTLSVAILGRNPRLHVAGIWRDYARPNGALVISRRRYVELTGDRIATEGSLWTLPGVSSASIETAIRARFPGGGALELMSSSELRDHSIVVFDRAFAITYALEALAVLIGLAGISVAASYTAITRRAEFGMLRHVGMTRSQVIRMLAVEGVATALLGTVYGMGLGIVLSLVLVFVINRQSFNWSIDLSLPASQLSGFAAALIAAAAITSVLSGRAALGDDAIRAVREDW
jgi:putative ABC transport system permease protein